MGKKLAFIVEDDPKINRIFSITLSQDFEVETCARGDEALVRLAQIVPALVILDLNLPGASGADILKYIRAESRLENSIVLLCTANAREAENLQQDADLVLLKPISTLQLRELASRFKS